MTNHWVDIKNADLIFVMGGNPAEAHPCGFKWAIEAKKNRKAKLVVVDPRFNRTASVADYYAPIRPGSDIAFLGGVINYLLSNDKIHHDYVKAYTNASFLIDDGFGFGFVRNGPVEPIDHYRQCALHQCGGREHVVEKDVFGVRGFRFFETAE